MEIAKLVYLLFYVSLIFMPVLGPIVYSIIISQYIQTVTGRVVRDRLIMFFFGILFILQIIMFIQITK